MKLYTLYLIISIAGAGNPVTDQVNGEQFVPVIDYATLEECVAEMPKFAAKNIEPLCDRTTLEEAIRLEMLVDKQFELDVK
jgi:hypothetical protein